MEELSLEARVAHLEGQVKDILDELVRVYEMIKLLNHISVLEHREVQE